MVRKIPPKQKVLRLVKTSHGRSTLHDSCEPNLQFKVLGPNEIFALETTDNVIFSLKVLCSAYALAMQEFTGAPNSQKSFKLLQETSLQVARGKELKYGMTEPGND